MFADVVYVHGPNTDPMVAYHFFTEHGVWGGVGMLTYSVTRIMLRWRWRLQVGMLTFMLRKWFYTEDGSCSRWRDGVGRGCECSCFANDVNRDLNLHPFADKICFGLHVSMELETMVGESNWLSCEASISVKWEKNNSRCVLFTSPCQKPARK